MYARTGSSRAMAVAMGPRRSALYRRRGLGQSISDILDLASTALSSGGSPTDVLASVTGEASQLLEPSTSSYSTMVQYQPATRPGFGAVVPLVLGAAVIGGGVWFFVRRKRGAR